MCLKNIISKKPKSIFYVEGKAIWRYSWNIFILIKLPRQFRQGNLIQFSDILSLRLSQNYTQKAKTSKQALIPTVLVRIIPRTL